MIAQGTSLCLTAYLWYRPHARTARFFNKNWKTQERICAQKSEEMLKVK
jgi:hypothetical protein